MPQQLDGALVAIGREHAGAAELEEAALGVARDQRVDVELAGGVEAGLAVGDLLAEQPIGADHRRRLAQPRCGMVDHEEVIAHRIEGVDVAPRQKRRGIRHRRHLAIEDLVAQLLRAADFLGVAREADFERADASERARGGRAGDAETAIGLEDGNDRGNPGKLQRDAQPAHGPARALGAGQHGGRPHYVRPEGRPKSRYHSRESIKPIPNQ